MKNETTQSDGSPAAFAEDHQCESTSVAKTSRIRLKNGLAILLIGTLSEAAIWFGLDPDRTLQVFYSLPVLATTAFLFLLWWTFFSGIRLPWRIGALVGGIIAVVVFTVFVRVRFSGEMLPILESRWGDDSEDRAEEYSKEQGIVWAGSSSKDRPTAAPAKMLEVTPDDWPGFRNHDRDGVVQGASIRRDWDARPPQQLWRHPVGLGWSSFAVVDGLAFTQEQRRQMEVVVCYNFETGEQIWVHADESRFSESMGGDGPRATPTVHESYVYALGATGLLNCLDARSGELVWSTNILHDAKTENLNWGMAGSPLIYDNTVIVCPGGRASTIVAYDRQTGNKLWSGGERRAGYSSPLLVTIANSRQILIFGGDGLTGHDTRDGKELWFCEWPNNEQINVSQPIVFSDEAIFLGSGYGKGSALFPVQVGNDDRWSVEERPLWTTRQLKLKFNSAVIKDEFVFGLDEGILVCLDLQRHGERRWKRGRYGYGQILLIDDLLLIQAESGAVALVKATPDQYVEVARFQALDDKTWNHPVVTGGKLLVRNSVEAACFEISKD